MQCRKLKKSSVYLRNSCQFLLSAHSGHEEVGMLYPLPTDLPTVHRDFEIVPLANMRVESHAFPDATAARQICIFALYNYILVSKSIRVIFRRFESRSCQMKDKI